MLLTKVVNEQIYYTGVLQSRRSSCVSQSFAQAVEELVAQRHDMIEEQKRRKRNQRAALYCGLFIACFFFKLPNY